MLSHSLYPENPKKELKFLQVQVNMIKKDLTHRQKQRQLFSTSQNLSQGLKLSFNLVRLITKSNDSTISQKKYQTLLLEKSEKYQSSRSQVQESTN